MTSGEDFLRMLFWLGGGLCCGVSFWLFAAISFYAWRKHTKNLAILNSAVATPIAALKPSNQLVRLEGVIKQVPQAIDGPPEAALAVVRLKVEVYEQGEDSGWRVAGDKIRAVPFLLEDETGSVWVDPQGLDKVSLGEGIVPSREAAEAAAIQVGIDPRVFNLDSRAWLWELRGGQRVTVIGITTQRNGQLVIAKSKDAPFVVTSLLGEAVQVQTGKQAKTGQTMAIIFGVVGLLVICCGALGALLSAR